MRPSSLLVQSLVLTSVAALVVVVSQAEFSAPMAVQPAADLVVRGGEAQARLTVAGLSPVEDEGPEGPVDGATPERVSERALRVLDRTTGASVPDLDLFWLPFMGNSELRFAATTDADGLAIVTVRGERHHVLCAWLGTRSIRPTGIAHGLSSLDRPQVMHLAGTATVRGRVLNWDFPVSPRHYIQAHLQIPLVGATDLSLGERQPVTRLRDEVDDEGLFEFSGVPTEVEGLALGAVNQHGWLIAVAYLPALAVGETRVVDLELSQPVLRQSNREADNHQPLDDVPRVEFPRISPGNHILRGVLLDYLSNPVANTEVAALATGHDSNRLRWHCWSQLPAGVMTVRSDAEGRFEFIGIGDRHVLVGRLRAPPGREHWFERLPVGPRVQVIRER